MHKQVQFFFLDLDHRHRQETLIDLQRIITEHRFLMVLDHHTTGLVCSENICTPLTAGQIGSMVLCHTWRLGLARDLGRMVMSMLQRMGLMHNHSSSTILHYRR
jgi:hypothetical protein